jgi:hypothetical protein
LSALVVFPSTWMAIQVGSKAFRVGLREIRGAVPSSEQTSSTPASNLSEAQEPVKGCPVRGWSRPRVRMRPTNQLPLRPSDRIRELLAGTPACERRRGTWLTLSLTVSFLEADPRASSCVCAWSHRPFKRLPQLAESLSVLFRVGLGAIGLFPALFASRPAKRDLFFLLALTGLVLFSWQTAVLDALVWPSFFPNGSAAFLATCKAAPGPKVVIASATPAAPFPEVPSGAATSWRATPVLCFPRALAFRDAATSPDHTARLSEVLQRRT